MHRFVTIAAAFVSAVMLAVFAGAGSAAAEPPSADAFAREPVIRSVTLSPDGKHIAALVSNDGYNSVLSIWKTEAMDQAPFTVGLDRPERVRFLSVRFIKNDRIAITTIQPYTYGTFRTHLTQLAVADLKGERVPVLDPGRLRSEEDRVTAAFSSPQIISTLPGDPEHILVLNTNPLQGAGEIWKVNVYTGKEERVLQASDRWSGYLADLTGEIRARQALDFDAGAVYIAQWLKHPDTGQWEEHFRWYARDRLPKSIVGFTNDPNVVLIATAEGRDKTAIFEYSIRERRMGEIAFEHRAFEAGGVIQSTDRSDYGSILGFSYQGPSSQILWSDEGLAATIEGVRAALQVRSSTFDWTDPGTGARYRLSAPVGADAEIVDWSDDRRTMIIEKSGPSQPPEYYLFGQDGRLRLLGRSRPWIRPADLGETKLVQYTASDGLVVPAFLTRPPASVYGEGPRPAIILPHGGPWARDNLSWDASGWTQYFASRGYVVLQPQFRGSDGWGQKLWRAGDAQWGLKMQDDLDDGARWLVSQGLAPADRIAVHGYSYGGYAAYAAAVRGGGLYQCAVAGAGVAELASFQRDTFESRFIREFQRPTIEGLDPLSKAHEASIPVFIYHGDRDVTVPIKQSDMFAQRLRAAGKPHEYLKLSGMGHGIVTWTPEHMRTVLQSVEGWLSTQCGEGGL